MLTRKQMREIQKRMVDFARRLGYKGYVEIGWYPRDPEEPWTAWGGHASTVSSPEELTIDMPKELSYQDALEEGLSQILYGTTEAVTEEFSLERALSSHHDPYVETMSQADSHGIGRRYTEIGLTHALQTTPIVARRLIDKYGLERARKVISEQAKEWAGKEFEKDIDFWRESGLEDKARFYSEVQAGRVSQEEYDRRVGEINKGLSESIHSEDIG